ncbi:MAG: response regulator, partial [Longimicrobiales bacterium]
DVTPPIRIVIADDHPFVLEGLQAVLQAEEDMNVVAVASGGDELLAALRLYRPDIAVLDLTMGDPDGMACLDRIAEDALPVRVVVLTAHTDPRLMRSAWEKGASGYALKSEPPRVTIATIRQVARGQLVFPRATRHTEPDGARRVREALTSRETAVLAAAAEGLTNARIASRLGITPNTVKFHLQNVYLKLGARTRTEAVSWYLKE